jgi:hypothetical protein
MFPHFVGGPKKEHVTSCGHHMTDFRTTPIHPSSWNGTMRMTSTLTHDPSCPPAGSIGLSLECALPFSLLSWVKGIVPTSFRCRVTTGTIKGGLAYLFALSGGGGGAILILAVVSW